jgi:hypothetical protein
MISHKRSSNNVDLEYLRRAGFAFECFENWIESRLGNFAALMQSSIQSPQASP